MKRNIRMAECYLICRHCKREYDMSQVSLEGRRKNQRNLYCPYCGKKVGTLN